MSEKVQTNFNFVTWHVSAQKPYVSWIPIHFSPYGSGSVLLNASMVGHHLGEGFFKFKNVWNSMIYFTFFIFHNILILVRTRRRKSWKVTPNTVSPSPLQQSSGITKNVFLCSVLSWMVDRGNKIEDMRRSDNRREKRQEAWDRRKTGDVKQEMYHVR